MVVVVHASVWVVGHVGRPGCGIAVCEACAGGSVVDVVVVVGRVHEIARLTCFGGGLLRQWFVASWPRGCEGSLNPKHLDLTPCGSRF